MTAPRKAAAMDEDFIFQAIRDDDVEAIQAAIRTGGLQLVRGSAPINHAAFFGSLKVFDALIDSGADWRALDSLGQTLLHKSRKAGTARRLLELGLAVDTRDELGRSALDLAEDVAVVKTLLEHGASVNARNGQGLTPLHTACRLGRSKVVEALLARGADPNLETPQGESPLSLALYGTEVPPTRKDKIARALLAAGARRDHPVVKARLTQGWGTPALEA